MSRGTAIRAKIANALGRVQATPFEVKLRSVVRTGGNALLGIGETATATDVVVSPQPSVRQMTSEEIASSGGLLQAGDYRFVFSGDLERSTLATHQIVYGDKLLSITRVRESVLFGTVVAWIVTARSTELES